MVSNAFWSKGPFHVEYIASRDAQRYSVRDEQDNGVVSFDTEEEASSYCRNLNRPDR